MIKGVQRARKKRSWIGWEAQELRTDSTWVSWFFLLSHIVPRKDKSVRDLVGNLKSCSLPRASDGWDPPPNCCCSIIGTPAGKLIHFQGSTCGTQYFPAFHSVAWETQAQHLLALHCPIMPPHPQVAPLSPPPPPQQKMIQGITQLQQAAE